MLALIPGLGCDHRVFEGLRLRARRQQVLRYLPPLDADEPLAHYAQRLALQLDEPERTVLLGVSFGGMLAIEIARQLPVRRVVIVSSIKTAAELPPHLAALAHVPLHRWLPGPALKWLNAATADTFFDTRSTAETELLGQIIADTDADFLHWAVHQVITWQNQWVPPRLLHVHGTDDRIFPSEHIAQAVWLEGAGHFMIVQRAAELTRLLDGLLADDLS